MDQLLSAYGDSDDEQNSINNQTNNGNNEETVNTRETENTEKNNTIIDVTQRKRKIDLDPASDTGANKRPKIDAPIAVPGRYISKREREAMKATDSSPATSTSLCDNAVALQLEVPPHIQDALSSSLPNKVPSRSTFQRKLYSSAVSAVRWRPVTGTLLATSSLDGNVVLIDLHGTVVRHWTHSAAIKDVQWHVNGEHLISGGFDKSVRVTDINTCQVTNQFSLNEFVTCIKPHPSDANSIVIGTYKGGCECWDLRANEVSKVFKGLHGNMTGTEFINQGTQLVTCAEVTTRNSMDKAVMVWDWESAAPISNQVYHESYTCTSVRRHPTSAHFLTQSNGGYVAIFSSNSPFKLNKHKRFEGHQVTGFKVGFDVSPDGQYVLSGSADGLLYCYTYQSAAVARKLRIASSAVTEVACHPVLESLVAMGTWDGTISLWQ